MTLRVARTLWWLGMPIAMILWLLAPRPSVIFVSMEPFTITTDPLRTSFHPILGELFAAYHVTAVALLLLIAITALSHVRRTHTVQISSLALPAYIAAIEACRHFEWFGRRHYSWMPAPNVLRDSYHMAAIASIIAVAGSLLIALALLRWCREGVSGRITWRALSAIAPLSCVLVIWCGMERVLFGP